MEATVIPELCNGCSLCQRICPEVFRIVSGKAAVAMNPVPGNVVVDCKDASLLCLTGAIKLNYLNSIVKVTS